MWEKFKKLKVWVVERVLWAEKELKGKTGAEKRAVVVAKLNEIIDLPWVPEWVEKKVIGWLVDLACEKLNILTDHDFSKMQLDEKQTGELVEALEAPTEMVVSAASKAATVDERLAELCKMYGIEREEEPKLSSTPEPEPVEPEPPATDGDRITAHFRRGEFKCKCGCGKDDIDAALVRLCETIRGAVGVPLIINSGCRCEAHNAKVGGVKGSYHTQGKAADLSCSLGARKLYDTIQALYAAGKLEGLEYCIRYKTFVHIDIGKPRSQRFAVRG